jgi:hypothetical protein
MNNADAIWDEHLAKFPPFKGPITGGDFNVDENVLSGQELNIALTSLVTANAARIQHCQFLGPR